MGLHKLIAARGEVIAWLAGPLGTKQVKLVLE